MYPRFDFALLFIARIRDSAPLRPPTVICHDACYKEKEDAHALLRYALLLRLQHRRNFFALERGGWGGSVITRRDARAADRDAWRS